MKLSQAFGAEDVSQSLVSKCESESEFARKARSVFESITNEVPNQYFTGKYKSKENPYRQCLLKSSLKLNLEFDPEIQRT
jgi:hypothetical protein